MRIILPRAYGKTKTVPMYDLTISYNVSPSSVSWNSWSCSSNCASAVLILLSSVVSAATWSAVHDQLISHVGYQRARRIVIHQPDQLVGEEDNIRARVAGLLLS